MRFSDNYEARRKRALLPASLAGIAGLCALVSLAGCGGASTSNNLQPGIPSGPAIYGVQLPIGSATQFGETSGFGTPDYKTGIVTGAIASNANPAGGKPVTLGFYAGGQYIDGSIGIAGPPAGGQTVFAVDISNGNNASGHLIPINPNSVVLTNIPSNAPDFLPADSGITISQPLHFQFPLGSGTPQPFADAAYTTNAFAFPFTTTGLHGVRVSVADTAGNSSYTDFYSLVLAGSDSAVLVQVLDPSPAPGQIPPTPVPGATVSITNALAGVNAYNPVSGEPTESVTDGQGVAIVFATPGQQTLTVSDDGQTITDTPTLAPGEVYDSVTTGTPPNQQTVPYTLQFTTSVPTFRRRR